MPKQAFFITGLPRSRTCWLANFLTCGSSFCYHEALKECKTAVDLRACFDRIKKPVVGDSDSGLLLLWREVMEVFPEAKWVVIRREPAEVANDYMDYFTRNPYPQFGVPDWEQTLNVLAKMQSELEQLWAFLENRGLRLAFTDLNQESLSKAIHDFVCGGREPFDSDRWRLLDQLRINPMSEKITVTSLAGV